MDNPSSYGDGKPARPSTAVAWADVLRFDVYWRSALKALLERVGAQDVVLAPTEFMHFFPKVFPLHIRRRMIVGERIDWYLFHKGMRDRIDSAIAQEVLGLFPHFANEVFILYSRRFGKLPADQEIHLVPGLMSTTKAPAFEREGYGALVKTFSRPDFLARCLPSIASQFDRVLVVDDGSDPASASRNAAAAAKSGAQYVTLGSNLGASCAFNVGLSMLLADLEIAWISTFDDDVSMAADGVDRLRRVAAALGEDAARNFYSGYESPFHLVHREDTIAGQRALLCRSCSGQHMHAHRSYWETVMPVPTAYPRAPKLTGGVFAGQGTDTDWWFANWAPRSAIKRGGAVWILPGLVETFGAGASTWFTPGR